VYGDADLLLSSYSVPLEYDPDLIQQVQLYCLMYCLMYRCTAWPRTPCSQAQPTPHTAWNLLAWPPLQVVADLTPRNARVMWCSKSLEVGGCVVWFVALLAPCACHVLRAALSSSTAALPPADRCCLLCINAAPVLRCFSPAQEECSDRERWYGTKFSSQPLPQDWLQVSQVFLCGVDGPGGEGLAALLSFGLPAAPGLLESCPWPWHWRCHPTLQEWERGEALPELHLPHRNPFVPSEFALLEVCCFY
jgi:hypothetical protein